MKSIRSLRISMMCLAACILVGQARQAEKVMGGSPAKPGEFPYHVSIRLPHRHFCSGSIIDKKHILTAIHCVCNNGTKLDRKKMKILSGTINREVGKKKKEESLGEFHEVTDIFTYGECNPKKDGNWEKDIAILRVRYPIIFNPSQRSIQLPTSFEVPSEASVSVSGWGKTKCNSATFPKILQKLDMVVISNRECEIHLKTRIEDVELCAMKGRGFGVCPGDSGGPLVYNNHLIGVASWGGPVLFKLDDDNNDDDYPSVFIRVYEFIPWIKGIIKDA